MTTLTDAALSAHSPDPGAALTGEWLATTLTPLAAQLVATVHDEGPDAVDAVLAQVDPERWHAFAVVLAAMVDPTKRLSELLGWTGEPPQSLDKLNAGNSPSSERKQCPDCGETIRAGALARHRKRKHPDPVAVEEAVAGRRALDLGAAEFDAAVAELTARGMSGRQIAEQLGAEPRRVFRARARTGANGQQQVA